MDRKMASVQVINGVFPIPGANRICQYGINGWKVIDQVGKYSVGDKVVYCEVDSWIPDLIAPFLTKPGQEPKVYLDIPGQKLKTIKLKGALSQGLILPLVSRENNIGDDISDQLGIVKWEAPPEFSRADAKETFPYFLRKTDQERIQNCFENIRSYLTKEWEVTEKLEGSSMTVYSNNGEYGVCSRNLGLKEDENNTFYKTAVKLGLIDKLQLHGKNIAIQGELIGPGIQDNIYRLTEHKWMLFDIFDIDKQEYMHPEDRNLLVSKLDIPQVPIVYYGTPPNTLDAILEQADGESHLAKGIQREGLVYKLDGVTSFKAVSNKYLLGIK